MSNILLAEDDTAIAGVLSEFLTAEGYTVAAVSGEQSARDAMATQKFDLLLLDISLSDGSGFGVCQAGKAKNIPAIFLTASAEEDSVVRGLDMGAEDYIAKPFRPRELLSRIQRVLRRYAPSPQVDLGGVLVDTQRGTVSRDGQEIPLSGLEFRLLMVFVNNRGRLLSRSRLLEDIWDIAGDYVNDNTLTVYIKRLREKLERDPQNPEIIKTVRGVGYRAD